MLGFTKYICTYLSTVRVFPGYLDSFYSVGFFVLVLVQYRLTGYLGFEYSLVYRDYCRIEMAQR